MGSPLRDSVLQMVVEDAISPAQKREHLTIKKKYSIVLACKWSGQGIDAYVQTHNEAVPAGGTLISTRALTEWLHAEYTHSWEEFLDQASEEEKKTTVRIPNYFRALKNAEAVEVIRDVATSYQDATML